MVNERSAVCPLCESASVEPETPQYLACPVCGTLTQAAQQDPTSHPVDYARGVTEADLRWLAILASLTRDRRLLDVGCGNGAFVSAAIQAGWEANGFDVDERLVSQSIAPPGRVVVQDLGTWEPKDERYGVVRLWFSLEHIRWPGRALRPAIRALRDGGLLQLGVPNDAGWLSRRVMTSPDDRFWEHPLHLHHFPPFGLERWLEQQGLELIVAEAGRPTELMRGGTLPLSEAWEAMRSIDPALSRLFYRLGVGRTREMIWRVPPRDRTPEEA